VIEPKFPKARIEAIKKRIKAHYCKQLNMRLRQMQIAVNEVFSNYFKSTDFELNKIMKLFHDQFEEIDKFLSKFSESLKLEEIQDHELEDVKAVVKPIGYVTAVKPVVDGRQTVSVKSGDQPVFKKVITKPLDDAEPFKPNKTQINVLTNLFHYNDKAFTFYQIALMCGVSPSGTFSNHLTDLSNNGLITRVKGMVAIANMTAVVELLGGGYRPSDKTVVELWMEKLSGTPKNIFIFLMNHEDKAYRLEEVSHDLGIAHSGTFSNYCTDLSNCGIVVRESGTIRLNPDLRGFS
jgi:predicted transcriptional regulator